MLCGRPSSLDLTELVVVSVGPQLLQHISDGKAIADMDIEDGRVELEDMVSAHARALLLFEVGCRGTLR